MGLRGMYGRRMRPTWGIGGCGVAKHGRILSSDRVSRAFARRQTRGKTLTSHFPHPMFSSKAARRRTTRARSARFPRRRYRLPRGISPRRSAMPCLEALPRGTHAHQRTAVPHVPGRKGFTAAGLELELEWRVLYIAAQNQVHWGALIARTVHVPQK